MSNRQGRRPTRSLIPPARGEGTSLLLLPEHLRGGFEQRQLAVRAKTQKAVTIVVAEVAMGTRPAPLWEQRRCRSLILELAAHQLPAPARVVDEFGVRLRDDGAGSRDYGEMDLPGAIRLLQGLEVL